MKKNINKYVVVTETECWIVKTTVPSEEVAKLLLEKNMRTTMKWRLKDARNYIVYPNGNVGIMKEG